METTRLPHVNRINFLFFVIGILILALGITFTILSEFGTSPFDALLVGLSREVGLTVGSWEIIIAFILIFCNALLKRKRPELLGLVTAFITGIGIDLWLFVLGPVVQPDTGGSQLLVFGAGLVFVGLGTAIYLHTKFAPIPVDNLMIIIRDLTNRSILFSRTLISVIFLTLALIFNGPIGIGTVITVFAGGAILQIFMPLVAKMLNSFILEKPSASANM